MAGIRTENKVYEVGIYCRLSKDDGTDNESASIATQKSILTDYVKKQGWHLAKTYVDDGYSGTNFQRPSFQNMIKDIENGLINCVITKDLSRLGRNYLDCGLYLEVFFPEHNVRYIAVNDGVNTLNKSAMDITPFRDVYKRQGMAYKAKAYTLREESTESGIRYFISFKDGQGKSHELEVSEQFFMEFRQMERRNRNLLQWDERHREFSEVRDETLNRRALRVPKSLDERMIEEERNEMLCKAVDVYKRQLLTRE